MTDVPRKLIQDPSAWSALPKAEFVHEFGSAEIEALATLVSKTGHRGVREVTRAEFAAPEVTMLVSRIMTELRTGKGAIILAGLSPDRFDPEAFERIYWGLGVNLGAPVIQNHLGDRISYVQDEPDKDNPYDTKTKGRGYRNSEAAGYHTDTNEIVGLMCVERAERGGESILASGAAIYNDFVRTRPDLLEALEEGYYHAIGEQEVLTVEKAPVFAFPDGLSIYVHWRSMLLAAKKRGEALPDKLREAMDFFNESASRNETEFLLEPGEILLWNNRNHIHGRRKFENSAMRQRLLLRLWVEPDRPLRIPANSAEHLKTRLREEAYANSQAA